LTKTNKYSLIYVRVFRFLKTVLTKAKQKAPYKNGA